MSSIYPDPEDMAQGAFSRRGLAAAYSDEPRPPGLSAIEGPEDLEDVIEDVTEGGGIGGYDAGDVDDETQAGSGLRANGETPLQTLLRWGDPYQVVNIAKELKDGKLSEIALQVKTEWDLDEESRAEWLRQVKEGRDMALQKSKTKNYPWDNASNVIYPMMTEAADQFAARAYPAIVQNRSVVKGVVIGDDNGVRAPEAVNPMTGEPLPEQWLVKPGMKAERAQRIGDHMSYQMLEEMEEWEEDTDRLLNILPVDGCAFRKTYYDPTLGRPVSRFVPAENLVVNYWAVSLNLAPRVTEIVEYYPYQIREHINSGHFIEQDYGEPTEKDARDRDAPHTFLEQHRRMDLDGDGYAEPYIVTVHKDSLKVARIVARWDNTTIRTAPGDAGRVMRVEPIQYYTKYDFLPNKEGGFYGHGFAHNLRGIAEAASTTLNQLLDAGHLHNVQGGFIGKGLGMMSGGVKFRPGEWKIVNAPGQDIRAAIVPLQHQPPSPVLFQLLGTLIEAGKDISSVKDVLTGEVRAQTMSPTVFMALVEQGLKVFTAIYKRIHRALKAEFKKVYRLNRIYLDEKAVYRTGDKVGAVTRADYESGAAVVPVSDPSMVADAQKMARTQVLAEFKDDPMMNGREIRKRVLEAASIDNPEAILEADPAPNPEMIARLAEIELKRIAAMADVMVKVSAAIKNMADADAKVQEPFLNWTTMQMDNIQKEYDRVASIAQQQQSGGGEPAVQPPGPAGGAGFDPGAMGGMATQPGNAGLSSLPPGLQG